MYAGITSTSAWVEFETALPPDSITEAVTVKRQGPVYFATPFVCEVAAARFVYVAWDLRICVAADRLHERREVVHVGLENRRLVG